MSSNQSFNLAESCRSTECVRRSALGAVLPEGAGRKQPFSECRSHVRLGEVGGRYPSAKCRPAVLKSRITAAILVWSSSRFKNSVSLRSLSRMRHQLDGGHSAEFQEHGSYPVLGTHARRSRYQDGLPPSSPIPPPAQKAGGRPARIASISASRNVGRKATSQNPFDLRRHSSCLM